MKRFLLLILSVFSVVLYFGGCAKKVDYCSYISEKRTAIYLYSDDALTVKIYTGEKESPYLADGIKSNVEAITEIYVYFSVNPECVKIISEKIEGEMNYNSVKNCFYLSEGKNLEFDKSVELELICDGNSQTYTATNVVTAEIVSPETALKCAVEYDLATFENLIKNNLFDGEIFIRILYDEGCYYYVGVCDKTGKIKAYLVDGVFGKVIAERQVG